MTLAAKIAEMNRLKTSEEGATEFAALAKFVLANDGKIYKACMRGEEKNAHVSGHGLTPRALGILKHITGDKISCTALQKAAQSPNSLAGSPFQDISVISAGFVNSLSSAGAFDALLPDMAQVPLRSGTVGAINVGATGYQINEGHVKPISKLSVSGVAQNPLKVHTALIVTQELARSPLLAAGQLIQRELRNSVAVATDSAFISSIIAGVTPAMSFGTNGTSVRSDLEWLLRQVSLKQTSRPYLITTSAIAGTLSQKENGGQAVFPELSPQGGTISGIPVLVSDAVPLGYLIIVDASMIAAAGGEVILSELDEAMVQLDDAPASPPSATTNYQSLWQLNLVGIRVERFLVAQKLTTNAVAIINNPNSYVTGAGSP